jgi:hypothetical protein
MKLLTTLFLFCILAPAVNDPLIDDSDNYTEVVVQVGPQTIRLIVPTEEAADVTAELIRATGAVGYPQNEIERDEFGDRVPENRNLEK